MTISHFLHPSKGSASVRDFVKYLVSPYGDEFLALRPTSKQEDAPCRMSATASSIHHQLLYISGRYLHHRNLRKRHTELKGRTYHGWWYTAISIIIIIINIIVISNWYFQ